MRVIDMSGVFPVAFISLHPFFPNPPGRSLDSRLMAGH